MNKVLVTVYVTGTLHFGVMQLSILLLTTVPNPSFSFMPSRTLFYLKFMQGNIRMYQGCRCSLRSPEGTIQSPPFDLAIARPERSFRDFTGTLVTQTVCHYHCSFYCIRSVEPSFCPSILSVPKYCACSISTVRVWDNIVTAYTVLL